MASKIELLDKTFERFLDERTIQDRIEQLADNIRKEHEGEDVVFVVILKGSLLVSADLVRKFNRPCAIEAIRAQSYKGMKSTGVVEITMTESLDLKDRVVIVVEDIVETGRTLQAVHHHLKQQGPKKLLTFSLLRKPKALINPVKIDYVGFDIDPAFVVGYGLDYDEYGRELRDIYRLVETE